MNAGQNGEHKPREDAHPIWKARPSHHILFDTIATRSYANAAILLQNSNYLIPDDCICTEERMNPDMKTRLSGFACLLIGLAMSWPTIFERLQKAREGVPAIQVWSLASFLVGPLIVLGLTMMILGGRTETLMRNAEKKRMTAFGNLIALLCLVIGFAGMLGTTYLLRSYGYQ
jgi:hypothetical protein